jgi:REP element-mobilizing transposase RayT
VERNLKTEQNNKPDLGWHSRGYLPHFDSSHAIQAITYRLHDSLPVQVIEQLKLDASNNDKLKVKINKFLDKGYGSCSLGIPEISEIVETNFLYFNRVKYDLIAWVIMPNHIHVMIKPYEGCSLQLIVKSWKSYTAKECNKISGGNGRFWFPDYWDRFIRDENHFSGAVNYIHNNPVKAGLVESPEKWSFSSARHYPITQS